MDTATTSWDAYNWEWWRKREFLLSDLKKPQTRGQTLFLLPTVSCPWNSVGSLSIWDCWVEDSVLQLTRTTCYRKCVSPNRHMKLPSPPIPLRRKGHSSLITYFVAQVGSGWAVPHQPHYLLRQQPQSQPHCRHHWGKDVSPWCSCRQMRPGWTQSWARASWLPDWQHSKTQEKWH